MKSTRNSFHHNGSFSTSNTNHHTNNLSPNSSGTHLKAFLSPNLAPSPSRARIQKSYHKFKNQRVIPDSSTSSLSGVLNPKRTNGSRTFSPAAIIKQKTPEPSNYLNSGRLSSSQRSFNSPSPIASSDRWDTNGFLEDRSHKSGGGTVLYNTEPKDSARQRSTRTSSPSRHHKKSSRKKKGFLPSLFGGSTTKHAAKTHKSNHGKLSRNKSVTTCKICGKRVHGVENYAAHMKLHENVSGRYFKEKSRILSHTDSVRTFLDDRSSQAMSSEHLRKMNLLNGSTTKLDALFEEEMRQRAKLSFTNAMYKYEDREWKEAFEDFQKLAQQKKDGKAMKQLGKMYENGIYVQDDEKEAFRYYRRAVLEGKELSLSREHVLAVCQYLGLDDKSPSLSVGSPKSGQSYLSPQKSQNEAYRTLMNLARTSKSPGSYYWLGRCYESGAATGGINIRKSETYYKKASTYGDPRAMCRLAVMHLSGAIDRSTSAEQSCSEAMKLYKKAVVNSYPRALYYLSVMYAQGKGVEQNIPEAKRLLAQAQEAGVHLDAEQIEAVEGAAEVGHSIEDEGSFCIEI